MHTEAHPLESFLHEMVRNTYEGKLGFNDPEITAYVARVLCDFSEPEKLFRLHDETGRRLEDLKEMQRAADPVYGTATSFDAERATRKYIGDYALFVAGMCHEILKSDAEHVKDGPTVEELISAGKESYYIVSQFNLCEYEAEAALFARLTENFEHCVLGLAMMREEMGEKLKVKMAGSAEQN